jgi:hypothetical protein
MSAVSAGESGSLEKGLHVLLGKISMKTNGK